MYTHTRMYIITNNIGYPALSKPKLHEQVDSERVWSTSLAENSAFEGCNGAVCHDLVPVRARTAAFRQGPRWSLP